MQLGDLHYDGSGGVTKDHEEANKWFRMAAEQGHPEALYSVGWSYFAGEGVERSVEDAAEWFKTVEWNYGSPVDPAMLAMVAQTLVDLQVIDKIPPSEALIAQL